MLWVTLHCAQHKEVLGDLSSTISCSLPPIQELPNLVFEVHFIWSFKEKWMALEVTPFSF